MRRPYKIQDILDILPDGNVTVCAVKQNQNKNKRVSRAIDPMDQYRFYCIVGECKFNLLNQNPIAWNGRQNIGKANIKICDILN